MRKRNKQGRFIKDEVSLTNDFKGLEINQERPVKSFPYVKSVIAMIIVFGLIALAHYLGWIQVAKNGGL